MQPEAAETLALKALAWLAADGDTMVRFLTVSGLDLDDLRLRAGEPELLAAIMDFVLAEDALLTGFAEAEGIAPKALISARRSLPGAWEG